MKTSRVDPITGRVSSQPSGSQRPAATSIAPAAVLTGRGPHDVTRSVRTGLQNAARIQTEAPSTRNKHPDVACEPALSCVCAAVGGTVRRRARGRRPAACPQLRPGQVWLLAGARPSAGAIRVRWAASGRGGDKTEMTRRPRRRSSSAAAAAVGHRTSAAAVSDGAAASRRPPTTRTPCPRGRRRPSGASTRRRRSSAGAGPPRGPGG